MQIMLLGQYCNNKNSHSNIYDSYICIQIVPIFVPSLKIAIINARYNFGIYINQQIVHDYSFVLCRKHNIEKIAYNSEDYFYMKHCLIFTTSFESSRCLTSTSFFKCNCLYSFVSRREICNIHFKLQLTQQDHHTVPYIVLHMVLLVMVLLIVDFCFVVSVLVLVCTVAVHS